MSSQLDGSLNIPPSYNPKRQTLTNYRAKSIDPNALNSWASQQMYKSSYAQFHSKDSVQPKTGSIPGYQGFIPQVRSQSLYGKRMSALSKEILGGSNYGKTLNGLATNGFNSKKQDHIDPSKTGSTSKYGRSSWLKAHPAWQANQWQTTTKSTYLDPKSQVNPTFREQKNPTEEFKKPAAMSSGYSTNRAFWDGTGWKPEKILKAENISTQYRNIYNPQKLLHSDPNVSLPRRLDKKEHVYKFNY